MAPKKPAKMGHNKPKTVHEDMSASRLVMITDGHRVTGGSSFTDCGLRREHSWRYGTQDDVTCHGCMTPEQHEALAAQVEVPPGQFEMDKVLKEFAL